jgi:hypothetical protein
VAPQRYALGEDPALIWMHLVTNLLIGLAYVAISGTLIHLTRKTGRKIPFLWAFVTFGVFIISCGAPPTSWRRSPSGSQLTGWPGASCG